MAKKRKKRSGPKEPKAPKAPKAPKEPAVAMPVVPTEINMKEEKKKAANAEPHHKVWNC